MTNTKIGKQAIEIFEKSVNDYHVYDDISRKPDNPYKSKSFQHLLYEKNWIDTVQWHLEDILRNPNLDPKKGLAIKHRNDSSNQKRSDIVEQIDDYYFHVSKEN